MVLIMSVEDGSIEYSYTLSDDNTYGFFNNLIYYGGEADVLLFSYLADDYTWCIIDYNINSDIVTFAKKIGDWIAYTDSFHVAIDTANNVIAANGVSYGSTPGENIAIFIDASGDV